MNNKITKIKLINGNCIDVLPGIGGGVKCIVTDPPFNIGYHYKTYKDRMKEAEYYEMLKNILTMLDIPFVVVHYPEKIARLSIELGKAPTRIVSWVYNSNTRRQHRSIAYWNIEPDFSLVKQPYKNPTDKRIAERIANGSKGTSLYDWWNINQVKNVSKEKTSHPCQMPLEVMEKAVGIIPEEYTIIDPFMGSGTTGVACKNLGRDFVGIEIDSDYFKIAQERIGVQNETIYTRKGNKWN